ncbi:MAG TPA: VOC family protein [Stellaceae bacterium]|nr:VOC family protein [Stellaceae bacterium]
MLRPKALDHVGLVVTDMDRSLRFYEALGLELLRRKGPNADGVCTAVLRVGDQEINVFSDPSYSASGKGERIHHFCFAMESADIADLVSALGRAGIDIAKGPIERRDGPSLFVSDPDGIRVELIVKR